MGILSAGKLLVLVEKAARTEVQAPPWIEEGVRAESSYQVHNGEMERRREVQEAGLASDDGYDISNKMELTFGSVLQKSQREDFEDSEKFHLYTLSISVFWRIRLDFCVDFRLRRCSCGSGFLISHLTERFQQTMNDVTKYISLLTMCDEDDDEVVLYECSSSLALKAFPNFDEIRRNGKLCDVVLTADDVRFSAHRIVLAATIPYFRAMFTSDMAESQQSEIHLQELSAEALEQLITFAYTGQVRITVANVQSMMLAANFLQLNEIVDECCKFLQARLHTQNVLGIRSFAMTLGCVALVLSAERYLHKHFLTVSQGEEFYKLNVDELASILSHDEIFVDSEEQIFEAAMRWIEYDELQRKQYTARILQTVRLPLLKPHYLTDRVSSHPIIRGCFKCRDLVDEAKDYHLMPERRKSLISFRTKQRCCYDISGILYAVGGLTNSGESLSTVELYKPDVGKWICTKAMNSIRSRVGVAVMNRQLYAIGGFNGHDRLRTVEMFDPETGQWKAVCHLNNKRSALCAAVVNEKLFVCGGYDGISSLSSVEVYDSNLDQWSILAPMSKQRSAAGIAVIDNYIYVLGGHDGMSIFNSVEKYNVETGKWSAVRHMTSKRCRLGACSFRGKIYACGGYDGSQFLKSMEVYDPEEDTWSPLSPMYFSRSRVSLVSSGSVLYAVAGYDGVSNLSSMEVYDVDQDSWRLGSSMVAHEGGVGVGVIPLPPDKL